MRWTRPVACRQEKRNVYWIFAGKPEGKRPLGRPKHRLVIRIILKWLLKKWDRRVQPGSIWFRMRTRGRLL